MLQQTRGTLTSLSTGEYVELLIHTHQYHWLLRPKFEAMIYSSHFLPICTDDGFVAGGRLFASLAEHTPRYPLDTVPTHEIREYVKAK